ncbi:MAG: methyltransferase domain-containing protein [Pseudolabrys sp.]|nr:methyltransferase domain-containing protein [Pseudolabrys sp.]
MNRKERRAAGKQIQSADQTYAEARALQQQNRLEDAARAYRRYLVLNPAHAEAINNFACVLRAQNKPSEASQQFARAISLAPQLFDYYPGIVALLTSLHPGLGEAMRRADAAWPKRIAIADLFAPADPSAILSDPLLLCALQSVPVRDLALERVMTSVRAALLAAADAGHPPSAPLAFYMALARQCFINEYVFATTPDEDAQAARLRGAMGDALGANASFDPAALALVASYTPLSAVANSSALLGRKVPDAMAGVITQQLREPAQEQALREIIPRATTIEDGVSREVRKQYEENPYPRWADVAGQVEAVPINRYVRSLFPTGPFIPMPEKPSLDVLAAGCGTGWQAIGLAQKFENARVLAVDLSLSSLSYAKRKTPPALTDKIEYAQADILKLAELNRSFDLIDSSGVLHHMADPMAGWRTLLGLLRPSGLMHLAFYSELGRRDIVEAREFIAKEGYGSTTADIRRARQDLAATQLQSFTRVNDFFSTSECRDMLFHVQEHRLSIPQLKSFMAENGLRFIGFEFDAATMRRYREEFSRSNWSLTDLDRWAAFETQFPATFAGMYSFWAQKE